MIRPLAMLTSALLVGGCALTPKAPAMCAADGLESFVGQAYTPDLDARLRSASGATLVRATRPGDIVTMEFNANRLGVLLDGAGRITALRCG